MQSSPLFEDALERVTNRDAAQGGDCSCNPKSVYSRHVRLPVPHSVQKPRRPSARFSVNPEYWSPATRKRLW